ncbi:Acetoacetyl-CoA reductase [compost metagenome]
MVAAVSQDVLKSIVAGIPVGRLGEPSDIARTAAFLARDEAGFITGATFAVNGGQYMG